METLAQPATPVKPVTGRTTTTVAGEITYRTVLMAEEQARRFKRCLEKNPRFRRVELVRSQQAAPDCNFYLRYLPASDERAADLVRHEQGKRETSAIEHGEAYDFYKDPDSAALWWVHSDSGEVYELTGRGGSFIGCTCPDWEYRGRKTGIHCKHMVAGDHRRLAAAPPVTEIKVCSECNGSGISSDFGEPGPWFFCGGTGKRRTR